MNDADLELAELEWFADCEAAARRYGVCWHNSTLGAMGAAQHGWVLTGDQRLCADCGQIFPRTQAWLDARDDAIDRWT